LYEELAKTVVRDSLRINQRDVVTITTWDHTIDVANAMAVECFKQGADAMISLWTDEYFYGFLRELTEESLRIHSKICEAFTEAETATINIFGPKNPEGLKKISPAKNNAWAEGERGAHYPRNIERKIRNVSLPLAMLTPERAKVYGFNLEKWKSMVNNALKVDLKGIAKTGRALAALLEKARSVRIKAPNGTNLTFELAKRPVHIDDGIIDRNDIAKKSLDAQLPAGTVLTTIPETSANGKIVFDQTLQSMGLNVSGIQWKFKDGKLLSMRARRNLEPTLKQFEKAKGDKDRIGWLQVGLNPKAGYGYLIDDIVEGAVQVGIGDNEYIGGKNKATFGMVATLGKATLDIDGRTVIKNGKLKLE